MEHVRSHTPEDITERKQVEEALRQSEEHYRLLFETMLQGVVYQDAAGTIISMNPAAERILGKAPSDFLGSSSVSQEHHTIREDGSPFPGIEHPAMVAIRTGQEVRDVVMGVYNPRSHDYRWINITAVPVFQAGRDQPYQVYTLFDDITERKLAVEALAASEGRYRELVETTNSVILRWDRQGTIQFINERGASLLGYESGELIGRHVSTLLPDVDSTGRDLSSLAQDILDHPEQYVYNPNENVKKDGTRIWIAWTNKAVTDEQGAVRSILAVGNNITALKEAEQALRDSEEALARTHGLLNTLLGQALIGFAFLDRELRFVMINEKLAEMNGFPVDAHIGKRVHDIVPALVPTVEKIVDRILATGEPVKDHEFIGETASAPGVQRYWTEGWYPMRNPTGAIIGFGVVVEEITERKRAEERLRQSEERFHRLFQEDLTGNFVCTREGRILLCNPAFAAIFGFASCDEAVGTSMLPLYIDPAERDSMLETIGRRGRLAQYETWRKRRDGTRIHVVENLLGRFDDRGELCEIQGYIFDDTKRKRAEEALRELNTTLESKVAQRTAELERRTRLLQKLTLELTQAEDRERMRMAEVLHDELQQQLAATKLHLGLLDMRTKNDPAMLAAVTRIDQMLGDAIEQSRSLSHELSPAVLRQRDLGKMLEWLARQFETRHALTVRTECYGRVESQSEPIKAVLYRAAQEILFNTVKHAKVAEARLRIRRRGESLCLTIADRGQGFDPAAIGRTGGFGLLSIRERVDLLGGRMKIHSAPGKGSAFLITLPDVSVADETEQADAGRETSRAGSSAARKRAPV